jgi:hypothetical protein
MTQLYNNIKTSYSTYKIDLFLFIYQITIWSFQYVVLVVGKLLHINGKNSVNLLDKELKKCKKNKMSEKYSILLDSQDIAVEECFSHTLISLINYSIIISTKSAIKITKCDQFNKRNINSKHSLNTLILLQVLFSSILSS